jgi:hypothetical protein
MEGAFYLWRAEEIDALGDDAPVLRRRFGIEDAGNAPMDPQEEFAGKNLLYVARSVGDLASELDREPDAIIDALNGGRLAMFEARMTRPRPHLDDKVLTAWNGLMIGAFARAVRVVRAQPGTGEGSAEPYLDAARRAARFIRAHMWQPESGTLLRRYRDGSAAIAGYAEDYAYLVFGLLELFQADPSDEWLEWAIALQRRQDTLFWDETGGGWFSTTGNDPSVLLRMKEEYDGAEPSASSIAAFNLIVLSHLHSDPVWQRRLEQTLRAFADRLEQMGRAVPMMAAAFEAYAARVQQVIIVGNGESADALTRAATSAYRPFTIVLTLTSDQQMRLAPLVPLLAAMQPLGGQAAAYVCRDFACRAPVTTADALAGELARD